MYYLVIIQNPGANSTQAVYRFDNIDDALAMYHGELAYRADGRDKTTCVIFSGEGFEIKRDCWEKNVASD